MRLIILAVAGLLALGACSSNFAGITASGGRPHGAVSTAPGSGPQMPQSPNSLPAGAAVNAPIQAGVGEVSFGR